jgi:hypothetical protein
LQPPLSVPPSSSTVQAAWIMWHAPRPSVGPLPACGPPPNGATNESLLPSSPLAC